MLHVVCFKWNQNEPEKFYSSFDINNLFHEKFYSSFHVNNLYYMLKRTQTREVKLYCITDEPSGIIDEVQIIPLPRPCMKLKDEHGGQFVKTYLFSDEISGIVKNRFIFLDLDVVITGDLSCFLEMKGDLIILKKMQAKGLFHQIKYFLKNKKTPLIAPYNSSFMVIEPYKNTDIWSTFDPVEAKTQIRQRRLRGTDQAWIYIKRKNTLRAISKKEGVYRVSHLPKYKKKIPYHVKLIVFPGNWNKKPWHEDIIKKYPWVKEWYLDIRKEKFN